MRDMISDRGSCRGQQSATKDNGKELINNHTMLSAKDKDLLSILQGRSQNNDQKKGTDDRGRVARFSIKLTEPTEDKCCEVSYSNLLTTIDQTGDAEGRRDKEEEEDWGEDIGDGYDLADSFIDNTMTQEEVILPRGLTTERGGFYVNHGTLHFVAATSPLPSLISSSHDITEPCEEAEDSSGPFDVTADRQQPTTTTTTTTTPLGPGQPDSGQTPVVSSPLEAVEGHEDAKNRENIPPDVVRKNHKRTNRNKKPTRIKTAESVTPHTPHDKPERTRPKTKTTFTSTPQTTQDNSETTFADIIKRALASMSDSCSCHSHTNLHNLSRENKAMKRVLCGKVTKLATNRKKYAKAKETSCETCNKFGTCKTEKTGGTRGKWGKADGTCEKKKTGGTYKKDDKMHGTREKQDDRMNGTCGKNGKTKESGKKDGKTDKARKKNGKADETGKTDGKTDDAGEKDGTTDETSKKDGKTDDAGEKDGTTDETSKKDGKNDGAGEKDETSKKDGKIYETGQKDGTTDETGTKDGTTDETGTKDGKIDETDKKDGKTQRTLKNNVKSKITSQEKRSHPEKVDKAVADQEKAGKRKTICKGTKKANTTKDKTGGRLEPSGEKSDKAQTAGGRKNEKGNKLKSLAKLNQLGSILKKCEESVTVCETDEQTEAACEKDGKAQTNDEENDDVPESKPEKYHVHAAAVFEGDKAETAGGKFERSHTKRKVFTAHKPSATKTTREKSVKLKTVCKKTCKANMICDKSSKPSIAARGKIVKACKTREKKGNTAVEEGGIPAGPRSERTPQIPHEKYASEETRQTTASGSGHRATLPDHLYLLSSSTSVSEKRDFSFSSDISARKGKTHSPSTLAGDDPPSLRWTRCQEEGRQQ